MKSPTSLKTAVVLLALFYLMSPGAPTTPLSLGAQEPKTQEKGQDTSSESPRKAPKGRVPNHYGKLGLTQDQKEEIYSVQAQYREQIEKLQEQINELQQQEAADIYLVLTETQKESLQKILAEVADRRKQE